MKSERISPFWVNGYQPFSAYADSEETHSGNRTADKVFDLQESTFWQTVDGTAYPHQIVIDLGEACQVTGFRMLPRAEAGAPGQIKDCRVFVKETDFYLLTVG